MTGKRCAKKPGRAQASAKPRPTATSQSPEAAIPDRLGTDPPMPPAAHSAEKAPTTPAVSDTLAFPVLSHRQSAPLSVSTEKAQDDSSLPTKDSEASFVPDSNPTKERESDSPPSLSLAKDGDPEPQSPRALDSAEDGLPPRARKSHHKGKPRSPAATEQRKHNATKYRMRFFYRYALRVIFFFVAFFYLDAILEASTLGTFFDRGVFYTALFLLPIALLCSTVSSLFSPKVSERIALSILIVTSFWYMTQAVYFEIFKSFLLFDTLALAPTAFIDYWRQALAGIWSSLPVILLLALPLIVFCVAVYVLPKRLPAFRNMKRYVFHQFSLRFAASLLAGAFLLQLGAVTVVRLSTGGIMSPSAIYSEAFTPQLSLANFGLATTQRLDLARSLGFGPDSSGSMVLGDSSIPGGVEAGGNENAATPEVSYPLQQLPIDFATIIENEQDQNLLEMHYYFANRAPSTENEYTGMFAGKNLLFITAEGYWKYAVHETYTPTLYKLANEGFVFDDFYNPLWWKSTTDGEYVVCTSLIPSGSERSFKTSSQNSLPFTMGNMLRPLGYPTTAYHNHTFDYYNRDLSHPNMGYDYYALGQGLEVRATWPESDLEMMELTIPQAVAGAQPFHNYYMTVSGHMNYTFGGNFIASKNEEAMAGLDMSEEARAYLATQVELDRALAYTLAQLEAAGQLENTVICLSSDHYPYGMNPATWDEFLGAPMDMEFEIFKSSLILWAGDMEEPIYIDKPCSSLDVLPTLLNLFGLSYDSRLLMGRDILSDSPALVVFSNRSFITDKGRYNASTDSFTPNPGVTVPDDYASTIYSEVRNMFDYSVRVLHTDYYRVLGL